jgi:hypothetical protein
MASLSQVIRVLSEHIYCIDETDKQVFNDLRIRSIELTKIGRQGEEPLITTEGRGRFSKDVSAQDCALLLISILVNDKANGVSEVVRNVRHLKATNVISSDKNLNTIAQILNKPTEEITLLDALVCILEDQAQGQEELEMVFSIMATHYKKLENQSMGFHISIDWLPKEFLDYSAINKQSEEDLKKVRHMHAFHEDPIWAKHLQSSFTSFGLSNQTIIQELKKTSSGLPSSRYQALEGDTFVIQKNSSYVRKIKIGGDVIGILADLIQEQEVAMKMMAADMAPASSEYFDEPLLRRILYYLMDSNIRSFTELNTKSEKFEQFFKEIGNYCYQQDFPIPRIGDIRDIQRRFHDLDRGKTDSNESINTVYEQYRFNKEKLQQTLTGGKKDT